MARIFKKSRIICLETFASDGSVKDTAELPDLERNRCYAIAKELAQMMAQTNSAKYIDATLTIRIEKTFNIERNYYRSLKT